MPDVTEPIVTPSTETSELDHSAIDDPRIMDLAGFDPEPEAETPVETAPTTEEAEPTEQPEETPAEEGTPETPEEPAPEGDEDPDDNKTVSLKALREERWKRKQLQMELDAQKQRMADIEARLQAQVKPAEAPVNPIEVIQQSAMSDACKVLGIAPQDFDQFDIKHITAYQTAVARATTTYMKSQEAQEAKQSNARRIAELEAEYQAKYAEEYPAMIAFAREYKDSLPHKEAVALETRYGKAFEAGDVDGVRAVLETIRKAYAERNKPKGTTPAKPRPTAPVPPVVASPGDGAQETKGPRKATPKLMEQIGDDREEFAKLMSERGII